MIEKEKKGKDSAVDFTSKFWDGKASLKCKRTDNCDDGGGLAAFKAQTILSHLDFSPGMTL